MRTVITSILVAVLVALTALSIVTLGYYDNTAIVLSPALPLFTVAMWIVFAAAFIMLRKVPTKASIVLVLVGALGIGVASLAGPPNTSTDSARYAWDGIVQVNGISPYKYTPTNPKLANLRPEWLFPTPIEGEVGARACRGSRIMTYSGTLGDEFICSAINRAHSPTIYPPTSELVFAGVRFIVGPSAQYWPMQLLGMLLSLATTVVLLRALTKRGRDPRWAALWAWSPFVATEAITNSHIDVLGALLLLAATLLASSRRPWLAGVALGAAIATKLIPALGAVAIIRRHPFKVIGAALATFLLLYVPYIIVSGFGVLGYLPGYLNEEGYSTGTRFIVVSAFVPGFDATIVSVALLAALAYFVWKKTDPDDPWLGQLVMIGGALLIVTPAYPWYALMLVPMIAMTGRWEWLAVPLALTVRLLNPTQEWARLAILVATVTIVVISFRRAGPGSFGKFLKESNPFVRWGRTPITTAATNPRSPTHTKD